MPVTISEGELRKALNILSYGSLRVKDCIEAVVEVLGENPLDQLLDNNRDWSRIEKFRKKYLEYKRTNR